jgi:amino acid transporter
MFSNKVIRSKVSQSILFTIFIVGALYLIYLFVMNISFPQSDLSFATLVTLFTEEQIVRLIQIVILLIGASLMVGGWRGREKNEKNI